MYETNHRWPHFRTKRFGLCNVMILCMHCVPFGFACLLFRILHFWICEPEMMAGMFFSNGAFQIVKSSVCHTSVTFVCLTFEWKFERQRAECPTCLRAQFFSFRVSLFVLHVCVCVLTLQLKNVDLLSFRCDGFHLLHCVNYLSQLNPVCLPTTASFSFSRMPVTKTWHGTLIQLDLHHCFTLIFAVWQHGERRYMLYFIHDYFVHFYHIAQICLFVCVVFVCF